MDPKAGDHPIELGGRLGPQMLGALSPINSLTDWSDSTEHGAAAVGYVNYELGRELEPHVGGGIAASDRGWPHSIWSNLTPGYGAGVAGAGYQLGSFRSQSGRQRFRTGVERVLEYIRAGDVYQVNLAHRLSAPFSGSTRALAERLFAISGAHFAFYLELDDPVGSARRAIISLSPELFLHVDRRTRRITTRPMKGTRPLGASAAELADSTKEQAELAMIVDLMRNDLGRVCALGSMRVDVPRTIEVHGTGAGGVLQATGTVSGILREDLGVADLLAQTFPGGSVTGTPKIRAMQIIQELEPVARGPYCGAFGCILPRGQAIFSIGIRTLCITGSGPGAGMFDSATADYSVGAGIVADSDPESEWRETLDKAWMLRQVAAIEEEA